MNAQPSDVSEPEPKAQPEPKPKPEPKRKAQPKPKAQAQPKPEPKPKAQAQVEAEAEASPALEHAAAQPYAAAGASASGSEASEATEAPLAEAPPDLAAALAERDGYLEDLQRVTAEFANFRRLTAKRNTEMKAQAASRLAKQLLPVLDACEAAASQGVEGIDAVQAQLLGVLSGEGLAVLGTVDEPFDPEFHEAVMSEDSDDDSQAGPVVAEILRTGYAWNGRVLRPAMVKVRG